MTGETIYGEADLARLRLEGLEHLNRLQSGEATERDEAEFLSWRRTSGAHEAAFHSAVMLQRLVRIAEGGDRGTVAGQTVLPFRRSGPITARRALLTGAIAASAAGVLIGGRALDYLPPLDDLSADVVTGAGQRRLVRLAQGASIDLNTRTAIGFRSGALPAVELIRGEALLSTAPRAGAQATLIADDGVSTVESGRFVARKDTDGVCVTCLAGTVTVTHSGTARKIGRAQALRYDADGLQAMSRDVDLAQLTAWQTGTLVFRNMPMRDVVAEINRYRSGRVVLANRALAERALSGTYRIDRLDDFFLQAELGLGVSVTRLPGNLVVLA